MKHATTIIKIVKRNANKNVTAKQNKNVNKNVMANTSMPTANIKQKAVKVTIIDKDVKSQSHKDTKSVDCRP